MFKSTQFWRAEIILTPEGYQQRRVDLRNADPRSLAAALRMMADQVERECQIQFGSERPEEVPLIRAV